MDSRQLQKKLQDIEYKAYVIQDEINTIEIAILSWQNKIQESISVQTSIRELETILKSELQSLALSLVSLEIRRKDGIILNDDDYKMYTFLSEQKNLIAAVHTQLLTEMKKINNEIAKFRQKQDTLKNKLADLNDKLKKKNDEYLIENVRGSLSQINTFKTTETQYPKRKMYEVANKAVSTLVEDTKGHKAEQNFQWVEQHILNTHPPKRISEIANEVVSTLVEKTKRHKAEQNCQFSNQQTKQDLHNDTSQHSILGKLRSACSDHPSVNELVESFKAATSNLSVIANASLPEVPHHIESKTLTRKHFDFSRMNFNGSATKSLLVNTFVAHPTPDNPPVYGVNREVTKDVLNGSPNTAAVEPIPSTSTPSVDEQQINDTGNNKSKLNPNVNWEAWNTFFADEEQFFKIADDSTDNNNDDHHGLSR